KAKPMVDDFRHVSIGTECPSPRHSTEMPPVLRQPREGVETEESRFVVLVVVQPIGHCRAVEDAEFQIVDWEGSNTCVGHEVIEGIPIGDARIAVMFSSPIT